jgi:hypothetical protein
MNWGMRVVIRKPRLEPRINGIPKDFAETRDYFNYSLEERSLPWIPRKTLITNEEILEKWIPNLDKNITLVAELYGKVVGQAVVLYNTKSNSYEHADEREPGAVGITVKPDVYELVTPRLTKGLIEELKNQNKKGILTTSFESPGNKIMQELGYKPEILENEDRYKLAGLSGKVCRYKLP